MSGPGGHGHLGGPGGTVVELRGCTYRPRWARALRTWDLELSPGEAAALIAPNGSGKSTYLAAAAGLVPATWERRSFGAARPAPGWLRYVPSDPVVLPFARLACHLELLRARWEVAAAELDRHLDRWGLSGAVREQGWTLSGGQQRAAQLAAALAGAPTFLLLDEPSVALDEHRQGVLVDELRAVRDRGGVLLVVTHDRRLAAALDAEVFR